MKKYLMGAALIVVLTFGAHAANDPFKGTDCKSEELNQAQLNYCAGHTFEGADFQLNKLYRVLMAKYDAPNQAMLKTAEKAWLAYREEECAYETNLTVDGTIHPMEVELCRTAKTNARIVELNAQLKCEEGDLLCNMPLQ